MSTFRGQSPPNVLVSAALIRVGTGGLTSSVNRCLNTLVKSRCLIDSYPIMQSLSKPLAIRKSKVISFKRTCSVANDSLREMHLLVVKHPTVVHVLAISHLHVFNGCHNNNVLAIS